MIKRAQEIADAHKSADLRSLLTALLWSLHQERLHTVETHALMEVVEKRMCDHSSHDIVDRYYGI